MGSVWINDAPRVQFEPLKGDKSTDVLIVGGGIAGVLCAYILKNSGVDCILLEADRIFGGVTGNTTAKITFCHSLIYDRLISSVGFNRAHLYLEAQSEALKEYENLARNIDCDYEKKVSFVYSLSSRSRIEKEIDALCRLGVKAEFARDIELPFKVSGAVRVENQAQFNPLKFLYTLSHDLPIYENTKVLEIMPNAAVTQYGKVKCKKMIIATHFPILNKHGGYFLKMYQHRSYVLALEGAAPVDGMYVDEADDGLSFRSYRNLLLLGGGGHRTGKKGGSYGELERLAAKYHKNAKIVGRWATQDCITLDGMPYIGQYSPRTPDLFVATGFNKWGMSSSMVAARLLCDAIEGKSNRYSEIFAPNRKMLCGQLAVNAAESVISLLTPTVPRCPHLGCALHYNRAEHSWDCPCHGSRFDENGKLLNNPATADKKIKK